jgi:hypothetical protein
LITMRGTRRERGSIAIAFRVGLTRWTSTSPTIGYIAIRTFGGER